MITREFRSQGPDTERMPTKGSLHVTVWKIVNDDSKSPQLEMWTDRGRSCILQGPAAIEFARWIHWAVMHEE